MATPSAMPFRTTDSRRGILWILFAMMLFVGQDAVAKYLMSISYPVEQVVWARFAFNMLFIVALFVGRLPGVARSRNYRLQMWRSALLLMTTVLFYMALNTVPLADANAIFYLSPVIVTALSMPLLGEHVGPRRWIGVAISCLGALIILRPGTEMMQPSMLLALAAACTISLLQIATRQLSRYDGPMTTLFYTALVGAVVMSAVVPFHWSAPDAWGWVLFCVLGLFGAASHYAMIKALEVAPAPTIAPFIYTNLIWSTALGFMLFGDLPDLWTVAGALIIAASGTYIFYREWVRTSDRI
ncbi:MAG: DMT family transporter [Rhodospirillales bacterium]|nr:DMT family transporter [Rhodospirillales bacterium]